MTEALITGLVLGCITLGQFLGGMTAEFIIHNHESEGLKK
jgi:hypothetical protein